MNTSANDLHDAILGIEERLRKRLIDTYLDVKEAYAQGQYDACGLRAGKFCEVVLRILQHELTGSHVPLGQKLPNFTDECRSLEKLPKSAGNESVRVMLPRAIDFVYTLRNKRDIGHVGGDVDANEIDAATCSRTVDWCVAELIRLYHGVSLEEAQELIDALAVRQLPAIWEISGRKRVLRNGLSLRQQTLCLLYSDPHTAVASEDLVEWIDTARPADFKARVLRPMHTERLIEYDRTTETVMLSPLGAERAETLIRQSPSGRRVSGQSRVPTSSRPKV